MKKKLLLMLTILALALWVVPASALTVFTPPGSTTSGGPVSASATFTIFLDTNPDPAIDNGHIDILLSNLQANVTDAAQCISDLFFGLTTGQTAGTLSSSAGLERTVAANGTFTDGSTVSTGWKLETNTTVNSFTGEYHLTVLNGAPATPTHLIIGPPDGSNVYSNANGSIAGNPAHNPFLAETAAFTVDIPGLTSDTAVTDVVFSFATTPGINIPAVPIPPSALLLGSGLLGLASWRSLRKG